MHILKKQRDAVGLKYFIADKDTFYTSEKSSERPSNQIGCLAKLNECL